MRKLLIGIIVTLLSSLFIYLSVSAWKAGGIYGDEYLFSGTYEVESVDRFSDPILTRIHYLGSDLEIDGSVNAASNLRSKTVSRAVYLPTGKNFCGAEYDVGSVLSDDIGALFTIKYRRPSSVDQLEFRVDGADVAYVGLSVLGDHPIPCFTPGKNAWKMDYSNAGTFDDERTIIVMTTTVNATVSSPTLSSRTQRAMQLAMSAVLIIVFSIIGVAAIVAHNMAAINQNSFRDAEMKDVINDRLNKLSQKQDTVIERLYHANGVLASIGGLAHYRQSGSENGEIQNDFDDQENSDDSKKSDLIDGLDFNNVDKNRYEMLLAEMWREDDRG